MEAQKDQQVANFFCKYSINKNKKKGKGAEEPSKTLKKDGTTKRKRSVCQRQAPVSRRIFRPAKV